MRKIKTYSTANNAYQADSALSAAHIPCALVRTSGSSPCQWQIMVWPRDVERALQILRTESASPTEGEPLPHHPELARTNAARETMGSPSGS